MEPQAHSKASVAIPTKNASTTARLRMIAKIKTNVKSKTAATARAGLAARVRIAS